MIINLEFVAHSWTKETNTNMSEVWKVPTAVYKSLGHCLQQQGAQAPHTAGGPAPAAAKQRLYEFQVKLPN